MGVLLASFIVIFGKRLAIFPLLVDKAVYLYPLPRCFCLSLND